MLDKFIFENHLGQRFVGLEKGVYMNYGDLRDYSWSYDTINNRISRFYHETTSRTIPLVVLNSNAASIKNNLFELAEKDIEAKLPGKIWIGEYYTNGFITGCVKSDYLINKDYCRLELTLTSDDPQWYREQTHVFLPDTEGSIGVGNGTDYPYDYPYDYALSLRGRQITCDSVGSNAFRLTIYGAVTNPAVIVGGHTYTVNGAINTGETLTIDSLQKTVILTTTRGGKVNWFDKRNREQYIFEPIPSGISTISWVGNFGFDLTVIEKRSEPKWT